MAEERLDFPQFYEGLFHKGLEKDLTPRLKERLRAAGLNLDHLEPAYPAALFARLIEIAREEALPALGREEALVELGRRFLHGYVNTPLGKALGLVMRAVGPMRTVARMQRNFRTGNNYMETRFREVNATEAELWLSETHGVPEFFQGILLAGSDHVGAKNAEVEILARDGAGTIFRMHWVS